MQHDHAFEELVELFSQTGKAHHKALQERAIQAPGCVWQRYNSKYFVDS